MSLKAGKESYEDFGNDEFAGWLESRVLDPQMVSEVPELPVLMDHITDDSNKNDGEEELEGSNQPGDRLRNTGCHL